MALLHRTCQSREQSWARQGLMEGALRPPTRHRVLRVRPEGLGGMAADAWSLEPGRKTQMCRVPRIRQMV